MTTVKRKKLKVKKILSILNLVIGLALMIFMIVVESEPGGIPLLLLAVGTGWYFHTRSKIRLEPI